MSDPRPLPCRREVIQAALLALCCALAFLRGGVLPTRAVVPFPPERYEPLRSEQLASGAITPAEIDQGNPEFGDKYNQSLAWDRIQQDRLRGGELPLWTRDIAGGAPFVPQMAQVYQPWNLLLLLPIESVGIYGIWYALHLVLLGVFAHWFLRRVGVAHDAALFGLVIAVLGLWTQARIHHNVILSAALPLFPLLTLIDAVFRAGGLGPGRAALIALCVGVSWSGGFAPVSLQLSLLAVAWAGLGAVRTRSWRSLVAVGAAFALGGILALPQMGPTLLAAGVTSRTPASADLLGELGLSLQHLRTLLWPDLLNWPSRALHDGQAGPSWAALDLLPAAKARAGNFAESAFAVGIPGALLALVALLRRDATTWFFAATVLLAFGLATASSPFLELSAIVPGARSGDLRRFLFLTSIGLCVLAALGADRLLERVTARAASILAFVLVLVCGWTLVGVLALGADTDALGALYAERFAGDHDGVHVTPAMVLAAMQARPFEADDNLRMLVWTYGRSFVVALAALVVLWRAAPRRRVLALAALTAVELVAAGSGTIVPVPIERVLRLPATLEPVAVATREAQARRAPRPRLFRLERAGMPPQASTLMPPNLGAFHGLEDLSAYDPLPPRAMEELFTGLEPTTPGASSVALHGAGVVALQHPASLRHPLLDLLDCRFVLAATAIEPDPTGRIIDRTPAGLTGASRLYERTTVLPRATFVDTSENIDEATGLARLGEPTRDFRSAVILYDATAPSVVGDGVPDADVVIVAHEDEEVRISVTNREPGFLRLADPFDRGWTATIDGESTAVFRADHYLRAVDVPMPGRHEVVFRYDGLSVMSWIWCGAAALAAVIGLGIVGAFRARIR